MGWLCGLTMSPNEFISVATQLLASETEGRLRSAVSRAYYGAFHVAREFLSDCGVIIGLDPFAHRNVRWCLENSNAPPIEDAARLLDTLRKARNNADYQLSSTRFSLRSKASAEVERAVQIATLLAAYEADETRHRVAPDIRAYASRIGLPLRSMP